MTSMPVAHLLLDTSSSNEDYNGDCDYCLVPLQAEYLSYLLPIVAHSIQAAGPSRPPLLLAPVRR